MVMGTSDPSNHNGGSDWHLDTARIARVLLHLYPCECIKNPTAIRW